MSTQLAPESSHQVTKDQVSRLLIRITRTTNEARAKALEAEKHVNDRHVKDAKSCLTNAASLSGSVARDLEELRILLGVEDYKVVRKKEFAERGKKINTGIGIATAQKANMEKGGVTDPVILGSMDQAIARYKQDLVSLRNEMTAEGYNIVEINEIAGGGNG